jgi:hypothetical protein
MSQQPVRSIPNTRQAAYEHGALTAAELAGLIFWGTVWAIDCIFTVQMVGRLGAAWYTGIVTHVVVSVVQQHLWRARRWGAWALVFAVGLLNVFSSAWGLQSVATARGLPAGDTLIWAGIYTGLATFIALAPERAGMGHLFALWRLLRR